MLTRTFCDRTRLKALQVVADSGQIGGDTSVEFMALADAGEASLVYCDCGYAADTEAAAAKINVEERESGKMCEIHTPGIGSIDVLLSSFTFHQQQLARLLHLLTETVSQLCALFQVLMSLMRLKAEQRLW